MAECCKYWQHANSIHHSDPIDIFRWGIVDLFIRYGVPRPLTRHKDTKVNIN